MYSTIILIGPLGAGKTTVGHLLAKKIDLPLCSVDDIRWAYFQKCGYDNNLASQIAASGQGVKGLLRYSQPFEAHMVEQVLFDHHGIIDFGASNSVFADPALFARVESALAPYPNVILLLPSPDLDESIEILQKRLIRMLSEAGKEFTEELFELNKYFVQHPSNDQLAKVVIYTKDKSPEDICNELAQKVIWEKQLINKGDGNVSYYLPDEVERVANESILLSSGISWSAVYGTCWHLSEFCSRFFKTDQDILAHQWTFADLLRRFYNKAVQERDYVLLLMV